MKTRKINFYIYLVVVIIPGILVGLYFFHDIVKKDEAARKDAAFQVATMYQKNWDQFTRETMTSLRILSYSVIENLNDPNKINPLLNKINQNDPRYGGIYLLDHNADLLTGTSSLNNKADLSSHSFIQEVLKTKDTVISNKVELQKNSQRIIGLATPVLDEQQNLKAILVAYLRMDYIQNLMKVLTPKTKLYVANGENKPILRLNITNQDLQSKDNWVNVSIDQLPWQMNVMMTKQNVVKLTIEFAKRLFASLIILHVLFLLIEYILLRIQTLKEREQNEIQKLELVGSLAASTAHEIRNPLTGVKGLIQLLNEKYTDETDRYYFDVINVELRRINEIVSEFLILGKPTAQITNNVNITDSLLEIKPLILSEANAHNVECIWHLPPEPIIVKCVKDQFKQVVLNITKNAFESFEESGILEIEMRTTLHQCQLTITDNGKGIPEEELNKIFLPFYTSKDSGTGLGLVICQRIIKSFGGSIEINSTPSIGTAVKITLPVQ